MNIYVGNMAYSTSDADLTSLFGSYGVVTSARVVTDRDTGRAKGFAFVEMANDDEAKAAIEGLNGTEQGGRTIVVNEARPREERPARRGNFNGNRGGNRW